MCNQNSKKDVCDAGSNCYEGHLCSFCLPYGHKRVFTYEEEVWIQKFLDENRELMDDLAKSGD